MPALEMTSTRRALLEAVAAYVRVHAADGVRVGVDGVDAAGKTVFADHLADVLRVSGRSVVRVSADDFFHQPRAVRHRRGRGSPEGFWLDSYDYPALAGTRPPPLRTGWLPALPDREPRPGR